MAGAQSPRDGARNRYAASFTSSIFDPTPDGARRAFVPAGKRRDQTTSEMFGNYDEKDLRSVPKTFVPKDNGPSAQQRKLQFLSSAVLPCSSYPPNSAAGRSQTEGFLSRPDYLDQDLEDTIDTKARRHEDLSSKLFDRKTPEVAPDQPIRSTRLTPSDVNRHSHYEAARSPERDQCRTMTHLDRAFREKCSTIFDHQSPDLRCDEADAQRETEEVERLAEIKRRSNLHYSDLFGRSTPMDVPAPEQNVRRGRHHASYEDQVVVHQDWTDSRTELMAGAREKAAQHPSARKSEELHRMRVFGDQGSSWQPPERLAPVAHDNSDKLRRGSGQTTQQIHQAHLRTSTTPSEFYQEAESAKNWEVLELHISGLPRDSDEKHLRGLCQGFDLQLVKVVVDTDPVSNFCKGRGKVMVRHSSQHDAISSLVNKLEGFSLRVEV